MPISALSLCITLVLSNAAGGDETCTLKPMPSGAMKQIGYYSPQRATMVEAKPEAIKKVPEGLKSPMFGTFPVSSASAGRVFFFVLDEADGQPARLWVDADGDGDLTNDAPVEWKGRESPAKDGTKYTMYEGSTVLKLGAADKPFDANIRLYRFDKTDPSRAALKNVVMYYRDYAAEGEIKIGEKTYKVLLLDDMATGDFRGKEPGEKSGSGVNLLIDVSGNGKFDRKGETFDVRKPFNIGGTTYEITDMARDGTSFKVVKSAKTVDEVALAPDLEVGKVFPSFAAKNMDGKDVKFPTDYQGKVVMVDFWATWCAPCMEEVPGLAAAYAKLHDQGFEVLGVTLDGKDAVEKIKKVTGEKKMTWAQIYDGKQWEAELARKYAIDSIPATFLIDGDTGVILAKGNSLRGAALEPTLKKHLETVNKRKN